MRTSFSEKLARGFLQSLEKDYEESEHPRDAFGRWAKKEGATVWLEGRAQRDVQRQNKLEAWREEGIKKLGGIAKSGVLTGRAFNWAEVPSQIKDDVRKKYIESMGKARFLLTAVDERIRGGAESVAGARKYLDSYADTYSVEPEKLKQKFQAIPDSDFAKFRKRDNGYLNLLNGVKGALLSEIANIRVRTTFEPLHVPTPDELSGRAERLMNNISEAMGHAEDGVNRDVMREDKFTDEDYAVAKKMAEDSWENLDTDTKFKIIDPTSRQGVFDAPITLTVNLDVPLSEPSQYVIDIKDAEWQPGLDAMLEREKVKRLYAETGRFGEALLRKRFEDIVKERNLVAGDLKNFVSKIWDNWKTSSTSFYGSLLQESAESELGANARKGERITDILSPGIPSNAVSLTHAYVRAQWEVTQFFLEKAGQKEMDVYRAVFLPKDVLERESMETKRSNLGEQFNKLPDIQLQQNGVASFTANEAVANNWDGVDIENPDEMGRVVIRAKIPDTAVFSLPVFGQNVYSEREVVVAGTPWISWDAWINKAPLPGTEERQEQVG